MNIKDIKLFVLILPLVLIWLSFGTNAGNIFNNKEYFNNIVNLKFLSLREILPHILCSIFLFLNFINFRKIQKNYLFIFITLILLGQLIGLTYAYFFGYRPDFAGGLNFLISLFFFLNYMIFIENSLDPISKKKFIKLFFSALFIIFFLYFVIIFYNSYDRVLFHPYQYGYGGYEIMLLNEKVIFNSNGISRILLFLYIFCVCYFFAKYNFTLKPIDLSLSVFLILVITLIYYYQSRFAFYSTIIVHAILFFKTKKINNKIFLIISILISVFIAENYNKFSDNTVRQCILKNEFNKLICKPHAQKLILNDESVPVNIEYNYNKYIKDLKQDRVFNLGYGNKKYDNFTDKSFLNVQSSGRIDKIKIILTYLLEHKDILILGGGPEYDRGLVNTNILWYFEDLANGPIYILLTGGLIGFLGFILLGLLYLKYFIKVFLRKNFIENYQLYTTILVILVILLRTLVEKSFLIWNFDSMFFYSLMYLLLNNIKFLKNKY